MVAAHRRTAVGRYRLRVKAAELFERNAEIAEMCRAHPFVQGIATGRLARASFAFYVGQDAVFLDAFVRAYALAVAKAPDRPSMLAFKGLLDGGLEELQLHAAYAAKWDVDLDPRPVPATSAYTDFLLRVAALEPAGHIAAAMAPCMRLYAWLGAELAPGVSPDSPYREWVDTYSSGDFQALAQSLDDLVDVLGGESGTLASHYTTAMRLELAFFDEAWRHGR